MSSTPSTGRKRTSKVWDFFDEVEDGYVQCKAIMKNGEVCKFRKQTNNTGNMEFHLASHANDGSSVWDEYKVKKKELEEQRAEIEAKKRKKEGNQQTIAACLFGKRSQYDMKIPVEKKKLDKINAKYAAWIASNPHQPLSTAEDSSFVVFVVAELNPKWVPPSRRTVGRIISHLFDQLISKIKSILSPSDSLNPVIDLWTDRMGRPFMGVKVHYCDYKTFAPVSITIAVRAAPHPHTSDRLSELFEEIWTELGLSLDSIGKLITDNGANIVKAFAYDLAKRLAQSHLESMADDASKQNNLGNSRLEGDANLDEEAADDDNDDKSPVETVAERILDYERKERSAMIFFGTKRISCFSHTLQLVVLEIEDDPHILEVFDKCREIVKKFYHRKLGEELKALSNNMSLVNYVRTRWSSIFLTIERLLRLNENVDVVLRNSKIDGLTYSQWDDLEKIRDLLKVFAEYTDLIAREKTTTISDVIPAIIVLNAHLQSFQNDSKLYPSATRLLQSLNERFQFATDSNSSKFDPVFVTATFLDLRVRDLLNAQQMSAAISFIESKLNNTLIDGSNKRQESNLQSETTLNSSSNLSSKQLLSALLERAKAKQSIKQIDPKSSDIQRQIQDYQEQAAADIESNIVEFWLTVGKSAYPRIWKLAVDILAIPATSASVERVFSTAGKVIAADRARLSEKQLEIEVLFRTNKNLVNQIMHDFSERVDDDKDINMC